MSEAFLWHPARCPPKSYVAQSSKHSSFPIFAFFFPSIALHVVLSPKPFSPPSFCHHPLPWPSSGTALACSRGKFETIEVLAVAHQKLLTRISSQGQIFEAEVFRPQSFGRSARKLQSGTSCRGDLKFCLWAILSVSRASAALMNLTKCQIVEEVCYLRFDLIYLIPDKANEQRDRWLARVENKSILNFLMRLPRNNQRSRNIDKTRLE
ncbi:hypothetical protein H6P81_011641 [Aristolochia fimbriata]|uniref:Uncharacterized protein n=1 Tax=Aristolochia fimbriata TaxID=158543 RepID=A0AAV7E9W2_ARIFI|nr:hypothetical protein H6P81_011641 [Aristolochia fimbriata]